MVYLVILKITFIFKLSHFCIFPKSFFYSLLKLAFVGYFPIIPVFIALSIWDIFVPISIV